MSDQLVIIPFKCNNVKNVCLLVNKQTFRLTKLKKNFCKTFFRLKNVKNSERHLRNQLIFYAARNAFRMSDIGSSPCILFLSTTLLPKNGLLLEQLETDC